MSWTRTVVSTTIRVAVARRLRAAMTPTPVTNIASVESMNGAPRIAPTPTSLVASPPPPNTIAMIGIIVSGRAVPTAARTDPTAPSASSSFRPNHSMPLVKSSAPMRMTTNAAARISRSTSALEALGEGDAQADHEEDEGGDRSHRRLAAPGVADEGGGDPRRRGADDDDEPEPDERRRPQGGEVPDEAAGIEPRAARQRADAR